MKMTQLVTLEDIAKCRHGPDNDIDLEAVYGGRISGRKENGLKINPIYHDNNHNHQPNQIQKDHNGNMNGVYLEMYETFPSRKGQNLNCNIQQDKATVAGSKNQKPALLGPESDQNPMKTNTIQQQLNHNQNHIKDNMKNHCESVEVDVKNSSHDDEVLSKLKKVPNGNYALLGYNNEGFEDDKEIDKKNSLNENSTNVQKTSLSVCHSIDSSPSRSSVSSSGSPNKNGKFLTEVSVHSVEHSESPNLSAKLESYESVTSTCREEDLAVLKSKDVDISNKEIGLSQEENSLRSKVDNVKKVDEPDCSNELTTTDKRNSDEQAHLHDVKVTFEEEKNPHTDNDSEIHSNKENSSKSKSSTYKESVALNSKTPKSKSKQNDVKDDKSSTRTLKSILHASTDSEKETPVEPCSSHKRRKSDSEIHEVKSVKFSKDTVFNESKPKKYKNEKIDQLNLRHIYHGRISSDSAIAKLNPLFSDDLEEYDQDSLTDDEKVAYRLSVHKMMNSNDKSGSLNTPAYMDKYLVLRTQGLKGIDLDIETLPQVPVRDRLIQRTIRKKRRKLIMKWTLVVMTVIIITATATVIGVYLKNSG